MNIALIGPRGAGKTKISIALSRRLKLPVLCLDALISYEEQGKSISAIIEEHQGNWSYFRDLEFQVLSKAALVANVILDCGGGIVVDVDQKGEEIFSKRKVELLKKSAMVFFLHPPLETVVQKIAGDKDRPALSTKKSAENIFQDRLPYYRKACHFEIKVQKGERKEAAMEIYQLIAKEAKNFFMG